MIHNYLVFIILAPFFCALLQIIFNNFRFSFFSSIFTTCSLVLFSFFLVKFFVNGGSELSYIFGDFPAYAGIELRLNAMGALVTLCFSMIFLCSTLFSYSEMLKLEQERGSSLIFALQNLAFVGFIGIVLTNDFFNLYVFLELASIASYALIAMNDKDNELNSLKTSFDYLIIGSIGATFYLLGVGFLYGFSGTLNMSDWQVIFLESGGTDKSVLLGIILITLGCLIKCAAFPFHGWLINVYKNSLPSVTIFLSGISSKTALFILMKYFFTICNKGDFGNILCILQIFGLLSAFFGAMMAIFYDDLLDTISYSSISQIGYIIFMIACELPLIAFLYFINHALSKSALFALSGGDKWSALNHNNSYLGQNIQDVTSKEKSCLDNENNSTDITSAISSNNKFFYLLQNSLLILILIYLFGFPLTIGFAAKLNFFAFLIYKPLIFLLFLFMTFFSFIYSKKIFLILQKKFLFPYCRSKLCTISIILLVGFIIIINYHLIGIAELIS